MYFLVLGLGLLALKYNELGPVADWAWWVVLAPFGLAVLWWAWADWSGLTKARIAAREEQRRIKRIARAQAATGQAPQVPLPPSAPRH